MYMQIILLILIFANHLSAMQVVKSFYSNKSEPRIDRTLINKHSLPFSYFKKHTNEHQKSIIFSKDNLICLQGYNNSHLYNIDRHTGKATLFFSQSRIKSDLQFNVDELLLCTRYYKNVQEGCGVSIWNMAGKEVRKKKEHTNFMHTHPTKRNLMLMGDLQKIRIYDIETDKYVLTYKATPFCCEKALYDSTGNTILILPSVGGHGVPYYRLDLRAKYIIKCSAQTQYCPGCNTFAVSPNDQYIVIANNRNNSLFLYDTRAESAYRVETSLADKFSFIDNDLLMGTSIFSTVWKTVDLSRLAIYDEVIENYLGQGNFHFNKRTQEMGFVHHDKVFYWQSRNDFFKDYGATLYAIEEKVSTEIELQKDLKKYNMPDVIIKNSCDYILKYPAIFHGLALYRMIKSYCNNITKQIISFYPHLQKQLALNYLTIKAQYAYLRLQKELDSRMPKNIKRQSLHQKLFNKIEIKNNYLISFILEYKKIESLYF